MTELLTNPQLALRIHIELLPLNAPGLNPIEGLWHQLKHMERCNMTTEDIEELSSEFHLAMGHIRRQRQLAKAFIKGANLAM